MNAKLSVFKNYTVNAEETEIRIHVTYYFLSTEEDDQGPGIADTGRCGCGVQLGGVAAPGFCSERPILGCDVGEL